MALTFQLKNRLLQGLNDDPVAFGIAAEWVDTEEKLTIFERQFGRAEGADLRSKTATAVTVSAELWAQCFADGV